MFTGIVQHISEVTTVLRRAESLRIGVCLGDTAAEVRIGDSVLIDGVCLTATTVSGGVVSFDVATETVQLTTLKDMVAGRRVNVELAMRMSDRFGGHFVSGHVDGMGEILKVARRSGEVRVRISPGPGLTAQMIPKGSVAVNGISLTIAGLCDEWFELCLIPHTMQSTTLDSVRVGDMVNIECDMLGKWVKRLARVPGGEKAPDEEMNGLTMEKLSQTFRNAGR